MTEAVRGFPFTAFSGLALALTYARKLKGTPPPTPGNTGANSPGIRLCTEIFQGLVVVLLSLHRAAASNLPGMPWPPLRSARNR